MVLFHPPPLDGTPSRFDPTVKYIMLTLILTIVRKNQIIVHNVSTIHTRETNDRKRSGFVNHTLAIYRSLYFVFSNNSIIVLRTIQQIK